MAITVYDTTLREGIQSSGLWLTVEDKLKIVRLLDRLGVHYIEAGNPAANQKDAMFFQRARGLKLHHAKLAAFGSTCRKGVPPYEAVSYTHLDVYKRQYPRTAMIRYWICSAPWFPWKMAV